MSNSSVAAPTPEFLALQSRAIAAGYRPEVLDQACVLVVGAGALGQNILLNLALSGVRRILIVDADRFESHNATRSPLFDRDAVNADPDPSKARLCAAALRGHVTHPEGEVAYADCWIEDLGDAAFEGVDVIVSAVDSVRARLYLARMAMAHGLPLVEGGFSGSELHLSVFPAPSPDQAPADVACWGCRGLPEDIDVSFRCGTLAKAAAAQNIIPALQNGAATLAGFQSEATIRLLHGDEVTARRAHVDLRSMDATQMTLRADATCARGHRRDVDDVRSDLGPDASAQAVIASVVGSPAVGATLSLPRSFVALGDCLNCHAVLDVAAPMTRFVADPYCAEHGGPWERSDALIPEVHHLVIAGGDLAQVPLAQLGVLPGDRVEITYDGRSTRVRLAGSPTWIAVGS